MASKIEKYAFFVQAFQVAMAEGYDFPAMSAFVDKYLRDEVPTSKIGNAKLLGAWGKELLKLVNEFRAARGDGPLDFPEIPDTRRQSPEERQAERLAKQKAKFAELAKASVDVDTEIRSRLVRQGLTAEHPVTSNGDVPQV